MKPAQQRDRVGFLKERFEIGTRRACLLLKLNRATFYYKSEVSALNLALAARIKAIAAVRVRYGYPRIYVLLRREGFLVNRKRVYRLYAAQGLNLRAKMPYRRRAAVPRQERFVPTRPNEVWAMDSCTIDSPTIRRSASHHRRLVLARMRCACRRTQLPVSRRCAYSRASLYAAQHADLDTLRQRH